MSTEKLRIDELIFQKELSSSIEEARSLILSGSVLVDEQKILKIGTKVKSTSSIRILNIIPRYVSRGSLKLLGALHYFKISPENKICIDMGASTGGFTQVLLEHNADRIYAFDVGYGQIAMKLRNNSKVIVKDRFNVRNITWNDLEKNIINLMITMDLSFISIIEIFPVIKNLKNTNLDCKIQVISLIKPQFECDNNEIVKGIVENSFVHFKVLKNIYKVLKNNISAKNIKLARSPIKGREGNQEFFVYWEL